MGLGSALLTQHVRIHRRVFLGRPLGSRLMMSESLDGVNKQKVWDHRFSVAPMMDYTNRYQRYLQRLISKKAVLYTEMITSMALIEKKDTLYSFHADFGVEEPVVLQLGGADAKLMFEAAKIAVKYGYRDININVGCPSPRVSGDGCFGAALMLKPSLVADLAKSVGDALGHPATVKHRIGVNDNDSYEELTRFIDIVATKGEVKHFIVHARKAILNKNFTPDDNRKIPPLNYDVVYRLVKDFPHLDFSINGGINSIEESLQHLNQGVKGVMVGRSVVDNPWIWSQVDNKLYGEPEDPSLNRIDVLMKYGHYLDNLQNTGASRSLLLKPIHGFFHGLQGNSAYRRKLQEFSGNKNIPLSECIRRALDAMKG